MWEALILKSVADELKLKETGADHEMRLQNLNQQRVQLVTDWDITCILLKYLQSEEFLSAIKKALQEEIWEIPQGPNLDIVEYAVQFWPAHYRNVKYEGSYTEELVDLLQYRDLVRVLSEVGFRFGNTLGAPHMCVMDLFYLGTVLGFADIVDFYLAKFKQVNGRSDMDEVHSTALYLASWAGHLDVVMILLDNCSFSASENLSRALKTAVNRGHGQIVDLLIEKIPNSTQYLDPALVCRAAELGYQSIVSMLIKVGADVNATCEGSTPLQLAARNGHDSVVYDLLSRNADPSSTLAKDSPKAIQLAASKGYTVIVEHLITFHADVCVTENNANTALHLASQEGHHKMVKFLLEQDSYAIARNSFFLLRYSRMVQSYT